MSATQRQARLLEAARALALPTERMIAVQMTAYKREAAEHHLFGTDAAMTLKRIVA
jgi:hypothetical protein